MSHLNNFGVISKNIIEVNIHNEFLVVGYDNKFFTELKPNLNCKFYNIYLYVYYIAHYYVKYRIKIIIEKLFL